jgi:hypothetical protein
MFYRVDHRRNREVVHELAKEAVPFEPQLAVVR